MKRLDIPPLVLGVALLCVVLFAFSVFVMGAKHPIGEPESETAPDTITEIERIEDGFYSNAQWWNDSIDRVIYREMAMAFIEVESRGNCDAYSVRDDAAGPLQICPVMVAEANRVRPEGTPAFTLEDRWSREKSIEIFTVVMMNKLVEPDVVAACDIWNPGCSMDYRKKVVNNFLIMEGAEL